jgi:CHASE2 domain-containing sensor protein
MATNKDAFHKKLGRGVRKYHSHFTKYLYERDTIFATLWVFLFIILIGLLPTKNLYFLNPVKLSLQDFDFNDISYSKLKKAKNTPIDNRIVIINIGHLDREGIAMLIDKTASMQPKVMGIDALFYQAGDPYQDSVLDDCFRRNTKLVVAQKLQFSDKGDTITPTGIHFKSAAQYGHVNFFHDSISTVRFFDPFERDYAKKEYPFFSSLMIKGYDSVAYKKLLTKNNDKVQINYSRRQNQYQLIQPEDLLAGNVEESAIKGKIALLGYVTDNPYDIEDKKFTPMNERFAGKSIPDMNGIVVHANIISMVLDDNYIKKLPSWVNWLVAILIGWLHMSFFVRYYLENHIWFHLVAKIAQLLSAIFFVYVGMLLFDTYNIKLDMKYSLIVIVLAVDVIYFYEAFAVWMHKKFHYHTVFHQKHH